MRQPQSAGASFARTPPRGAAAPALTSLLAAITALVLTGFAFTLGPSFTSPGVGAAAAQTALVRRFYAAANAVLASGDPAGVDAVLAPDFVAHDPTGPALDRAGLAARFAAAARAAPDLQFEVATMVAGGGWIAAQVTTAGGTLAAGGATAFPTATTTTELLQVIGDRITGYWPARGLDDLPEALPPIALAFGITPAPVTLTRVVYAPGASLDDLSAPGPQLLLLESGRLTVHLDGAASWFAAAHPEFGWQTTAQTGQTLTLEPGDALFVPAAVDQTQRNLDPEPAVTLSLAIFPSTAGGNPARIAFSSVVALAHAAAAQAPDLPRILAMFNPAQRGMWTPWPGGVRADVLAAGYGPMAARSCAGGPIALTVTRFSLPPGGVIPAQPRVGVALLARDDDWLSGDPATAAAGTPPAPPEASTRADEGLVNVDDQLGPVRNLGARPLDLVLFTVMQSANRVSRSGQPMATATPACGRLPGRNG